MLNLNPMHRPGERRSGFTLVELLVVIAIIGALAGLLAPQVMSARRKAGRVQCLNNVKGIGGMCFAFAEETKNRGIFPFGSGQQPLAFESLQVLVNMYSDDLKPELFVCPASLDLPAVVDEEGMFELDESSCSYAYVSSKKKNTSSASTILLSDDSVKDESEGIEENHAEGVNVFFLDSSAKWYEKEEHFPDDDLPKGLIGNN